MTEIARAYVGLAHAIDQYQPGYIDAYFGPDAWKSSEKRPLDSLARDADELATAVSALEEGEQRTFLAAQVRAMQTSIALMQGQSFSYAEEIRLLYDIEPPRVSEATFEAAIAALDDLLPGTGDIAQREQAFRAQFNVPPDRLAPLLDVIVDELARRTRALFPMPEQEAFEVAYVKNQPWGAYNWYLGNYRSRIDMNTDLPTRLVYLPDLVAHEAYPGHHTEHVLKEQRLLHEQGRGEHSVLLINAPECVVSEGIATRARRAVMSDATLHDWIESDLAERAGLAGRDVARLYAINEHKKALRGVSGNAAFLLHEDGASDAEVIAYLQRYGLSKADEVRKTIQFLRDPNFRSYTFTYTVGSELVDQLLAKGDAQGWFARLLTEPVTPGVLREWATP